MSSLLSVNKEIFALPFIALALTGDVRRSALAVIAALLVSALVRWQLTGFYLVMLLLSAGRLRLASRGTILAALLLATSAFWYFVQEWLEPVIAFVEMSIENYDEGGSGPFEATLNYQKLGLYFLVFPVKAAHLLFGLGLKVDKLLSPAEIYNDFFVGGHCFISLLVFLALLARRRLQPLVRTQRSPRSYSL